MNLYSLGALIIYPIDYIKSKSISADAQFTYKLFVDSTNTILHVTDYYSGLIKV